MRLTGKHGKLILGGITIGYMEESTVELGATTEECSSWDDDWDINEPIRGNWKLTAKKWCLTANVAGFLELARLTPTTAIPLSVVLYRTPAASAADIIFTGDGYVDKGDLSLPKGKLQSNLSIIGTGAPTTPNGYSLV